ncbi:YbaB/EbfC family nucleoid-associated protein [Lentzea aerocolonigenes]|uniref:YbaB/EbfC family nucleoid-associated protein n=1 Tax=Lentzea aerocolonigenes TaxID=68170 RepID=UPI0004C41CCA|nr:YbaB/EbfC family nucleoid-associated protein [Lentzea aerocolonigenes]MCP2249987.1 Conserved DNA-binding protein YbaB [Lentzea aerocolonigenes]
MDDHRAQVEELLADYRRSREQLASVQRELAAVSGRASSPDGMVTATVGTGGKLLSLELSELAYRRHRPEQLAELIVRTVGAAAASAAEGTYQTLSAVLPAATDPAALVAGTADLRPAEYAVDDTETVDLGRQPVRRRVDDDEDNEQRESWLDSELINRRVR